MFLLFLFYNVSKSNNNSSRRQWQSNALRNSKAVFKAQWSTPIIAYHPTISHIHLWEELAMEYPLNHVIDVVEGGETRYQSVQNGMKILENKKNVKVVGVHDGVRPLVSQTTISTCFEHAYLTGNAIPFMPIDETLRKITEHTSHWVNRAEYVSIQTPQCFKTEILQNAYAQNYNHTFTDDASVVESIGQKMNLVAGNRENIKITRPEDLVFAEKLITQ